jgi:PDZ domain-containing protein
MSTSEATLPSPTSTHARRRRRRWPFVVVPLAVLAAVVLALSLITAPYTELVPGEALPVNSLIAVPAGQSHAPHGKVLLTDVGVNTLRYISYYYERLFGPPSNDFVPTGELTANLPMSEFDAQGTVDMSESQLTAKAVALRQLGYSVPEHDVGVTVYVIAPGSPAWHALQVGDVIESLDGSSTHSPQALVDAVMAHRPGEVVTLRVGSITNPTPGRVVSLRLASRTARGKTVPFMGIGDPGQSGLVPMGTQPQYDFPLQVNINSDDIGGPSAGLAFTLGILNSLGGGNLTGGHVVAATGTIHPDGTVGDVGGVKQKTVAVERAGATVFLVPKTVGDTELHAARSVATPGLKIYEVGSLDEALADLHRLGGSPGRASAGPPPGLGGHSVPFDWQDSPWT